MIQSLPLHESRFKLPQNSIPLDFFFKETAMAQRQEHKIKSLPFNPARLQGLSEKLIVSHHENNYGGALKNLNKVQGQIAELPKDAPPFLIGALKERELMFTGSVVLHELYFGNLGGSGKASGSVADALKSSYGSAEQWETDFRQTGASLGGGSGWVILALNLVTGEVRNYWSGHHTQCPATAIPLLVMDMYEHSYHLDYGAAALKYIDTFFQNIQWEEVNRRYEAARTMMFLPRE